MELYAAVQDHDLEGIVAKHRNDPYNSLAKWYKSGHRFVIELYVPLVAEYL